jgi:monoamine oxidase
MGTLNKCYLRFESGFWPEDVDWLQYIPREHGVWTEWVSFAHVANKPILLGFNAGDHGRQIESWINQQIVDSAMKTLRTIFGPNTPDPIDYQITRWSTDSEQGLLCRGSNRKRLLRHSSRGLLVRNARSP